MSKAVAPVAEIATIVQPESTTEPAPVVVVELPEPEVLSPDEIVAIDSLRPIFGDDRVRQMYTEARARKVARRRELAAAELFTRSWPTEFTLIDATFVYEGHKVRAVNGEGGIVCQAVFFAALPKAERPEGSANKPSKFIARLHQYEVEGETSPIFADVQDLLNSVAQRLSIEAPQKREVQHKSWVPKVFAEKGFAVALLHRTNGQGKNLAYWKVTSAQ